MNIPKHTYHVLQNKGWNAFWTEWLVQVLAYFVGYYSWFYLFPVILNRPYPKVTLISTIIVGITSILVVVLVYRPLSRLLPSEYTTVLYSITDTEGSKTYMLVRGKYLYGKATGTVYTTEEAREMPLGEFLATYPEAYVNDEGEVDIK